MNRILISSLSIGVIAAAVIGCGGGGGGGGSSSGGGSQVTQPTNGVQVAPVNASVTQGQTLIVTAQEFKNGQTVSVVDSNWQWSTSNASVATITPLSDGTHFRIQVNAVAAGTTIITATDSSDQEQGSTTITVNAASTGSTTSGTSTSGTSTSGTSTSGTSTSGTSTTGTSTGGTTTSGTTTSGTSTSGTSTSGTSTSGTSTGGASTGGSTTGGNANLGKLVYTNDFSGTVGSEWSDHTTDVTPNPYPNGTARHFLGQYGVKQVTLSLASLPTHSTATVLFDFYAIRSLDGNGYSGYPACTLKLDVVGGQNLMYSSFSNVNSKLGTLSGYPTGFNQSYPGTYPTGNYPYTTGAAEVNTLGYLFPEGGGANAIPDDSVYHMQYSFSHSSSSLGLTWNGNVPSGLSDESWGITNVQVYVK